MQQERYIPRTLEQTVRKVSSLFKVVLVTGMRQVGKSTCLMHMSEERRRVLSFDDFDVFMDATSDPAAFFKRNPFPVMLDEIQRVPGIFLPLKAAVDRETESGLVWATGSQRFSMMKGVTESLAGRILALELMPLSLYEHYGFGAQHKPYIPSSEPGSILPEITEDELWRLIWQGGWPKTLGIDDELHHAYFQGIVETYLERDVFQTIGISKRLEFRQFLRALASRTGQELRLNTLAKEAGVSEVTIKGWISVAQASGVIYLLRPYAANINKQLAKKPKIYFTDTGLAAWLCGFNSPERLREYKDAGAFFETFVVMEILKSYLHNGLPADLMYFRDSRLGTEIDLLIRRDNRLYPVEIKAKSRPTTKDIKNFSVLADFPEEIGHGAVICTAPKPYALSETCTVHGIRAL